MFRLQPIIYIVSMSAASLDINLVRIQLDFFICGTGSAVRYSLPVREDFSVCLAVVNISLAPFGGICRVGGLAGLENFTSPAPYI